MCKAVGVSDTECGRIWLIECAGVRNLVVLFTGEGQKESQLGWWEVALIEALRVSCLMLRQAWKICVVANVGDVGLT
jgi:hypothetical protein